MKPLNDGGPIAPNMIQRIPLGDGFTQVTQLEAIGGLTIRDWFAGMALQGMFANSALTDTFSHHRMMVEEALNVADDMLAARERKEGA